MKTKFYTLLIFFKIFLFVSCEDELTDNIELNQNAKTLQEEEFSQIEDGRLSFVDESQFETFYREARENDDEIFAEKMEKEFYSKEFYSLIPIVNENNDLVQLERHVAKLQTMGIPSKSGKGSLMSKQDFSEGQDVLENIFGEEKFASLLNQNGEIEVGKKIYKYTDVGLFVVKKGQIKKLYKYLDNQGISLNFMKLTPKNTRIDYITKARNTYRSCEPMLMAFDDSNSGLRNAEYFIAAGDCGGTGGGGTGGGGTGGGSGGTSGSNTSSVDEINRALSRLSPCETNEPWLSNLFGTVKNCEDRYNSDHRVKTKFFSNNYLLAYEVGFKTKHQKKGWTGLWRKQRTTKMAAGINSVTWSYSPEIFSFPQYEFPINYWVTETGELYSTMKGYYNAVYQGKGNIPLPELPFVRNADIVVELLVNDFGKFKTEREVRSFFYENLYGMAENVLKKARNEQLKNAVVIINTPTQLIVQNYNLGFECNNCDIYDKNFDWGVITPVINYQFANGKGFTWGNFGFKAKFNFKRPKATGISAYGLAKRDGVWHGSKMEFAPNLK